MRNEDDVLIFGGLISITDRVVSRVRRKTGYEHKSDGADTTKRVLSLSLVIVRYHTLSLYVEEAELSMVRSQNPGSTLSK